jgi:hypothetical protein
MIVKDSKGKEVEISVYGNDPDDIQIDEAFYVETKEDVSDDEIQYIYDAYSDSIYESWLDKQIGAAEAYYEGDR